MAARGPTVAVPTPAGASRRSTEAAPSARSGASVQAATLGPPVARRRLLSATLPAQVEVAPASDPAEARADAFASAFGGGGSASGHALGDAQSSGGRGTPAPAIVRQALAGSGRPLEPSVRGTLEEAAGADLSAVRVHTDGLAGASAAAIGARAYTIGRDIVFGAGEYQPWSQSGRWLLAHEVAHLGTNVVRRADDGGKTTGADYDLSEWTELKGDALRRYAYSPAQYLMTTLGLGFQEIVRAVLPKVSATNSDKVSGQFQPRADVTSFLVPTKARKAVAPLTVSLSTRPGLVSEAGDSQATPAPAGTASPLSASWNFEAAYKARLGLGGNSDDAGRVRLMPLTPFALAPGGTTALGIAHNMLPENLRPQLRLEPEPARAPHNENKIDPYSVTPSSWDALSQPGTLNSTSAFGKDLPWSPFSLVFDFGTGVGKGIEKTALGLAHLLRRPDKAAEGILALVRNLPQGIILTRLAPDTLSWMTGYLTTSELLTKYDKTCEEVGTFWSNLASSIGEPYKVAFQEGKPAEALGLFTVEILSLVYGPKGLDKLLRSPALLKGTAAVNAAVMQSARVIVRSSLGMLTTGVPSFALGAFRPNIIGAMRDAYLRAGTGAKAANVSKASAGASKVAEHSGLGWSRKTHGSFTKAADETLLRDLQERLYRSGYGPHLAHDRRAQVLADVLENGVKGSGEPAAMFKRIAEGKTVEEVMMKIQRGVDNKLFAVDARNALARRHVVSDHDMTLHFDEAWRTMPPKERYEALKLMTERPGLKGKVSAPQAPDSAGVFNKEALAQHKKVLNDIHKEFFSDSNNLWIGSSAENSAVKAALDPHSTMSATELAVHLDAVKSLYGVPGLKFNVTIQANKRVPLELVIDDLKSGRFGR